MDCKRYLDQLGVKARNDHGRRGGKIAGSAARFLRDAGPLCVWPFPAVWTADSCVMRPCFAIVIFWLYMPADHISRQMKRPMSRAFAKKMRLAPGNCRVLPVEKRNSWEKWQKSLLSLQKGAFNKLEVTGRKLC